MSRGQRRSTHEIFVCRFGCCNRVLWDQPSVGQRRSRRPGSLVSAERVSGSRARARRPGPRWQTGARWRSGPRRQAGARRRSRARWQTGARRRPGPRWQTGARRRPGPRWQAGPRSRPLIETEGQASARVHSTRHVLTASRSDTGCHGLRRMVLPNRPPMMPVMATGIKCSTSMCLGSYMHAICIIRAGSDAAEMPRRTPVQPCYVHRHSQDGRSQLRHPGN